MNRIWIGIIIDDQKPHIDHLLDMVEEIGYVQIAKRLVIRRKPGFFYVPTKWIL